MVREVPVTESARSKKGRYYIADNFVAFWFRYIHPNLSAIEEGLFDVEEIRHDYSRYLGFVFEKVARQFLIELNRRGKLPFKFSKVGRWWHKDKEIDLIALSEREKKALFVEVKWKSLKDKEVERILNKLEKIAELTGLDEYEKYFGVFAKSVEFKSGLVWDLGDLASFENRE